MVAKWEEGEGRGGGSSCFGSINLERGWQVSECLTWMDGEGGGGGEAGQEGGGAGGGRRSRRAREEEEEE